MKISKYIKTGLVLLAVSFTAHSCTNKDKTNETKMNTKDILEAKILQTKITPSYSINRERLAAH